MKKRIYYLIILMIFIQVAEISFLWKNLHSAALQNDNGTWLSFYKEYITIECNENTIKIHGKYFFKNLKDSKVNAIISYPLPIDEKHPFPEIYKVNGFKCWNDNKNIYWDMSFQPKEKISVDVHYEQKTNDKSGKYILSSTQRWNMPLDSAKFTISFPIKTRDINLSYKPDQVRKKKGRIVYTIVRHSFMPSKDLEINWK